MKKNINPIIKTLISIFLLLSLSSCENIFSKLEPLESANSNSSDKAYIKINVVQESSERTIIPTIDLNLLSGISLRGRKADNNNVSDANLLSGNTWEAFSSQTLAVDPGEWEFNLSASLNINSNGATTLRGTKTVTLQQRETTTLNFTLAPSSSSTTTKGGLYVKVNFEDPSKKVTKVVATLMDEAKENIQGDPQSITGTSIKSPTGSPRYIEYKISNSSTYGIEQGTYFLTLEFFAGSDSAGWVSLNTISSYVRINAYYTSAATFDLDLNELYTISYKYYLLDEELSSNTGISIAADSPSTVLPTAFSRRSAITLPTLTYSDTTYQFAGWYESNDFSGTPVTGIARGSFGNKTLYARFISSTLYVSQTGNNENNGLTESTALATVTKAVEQIISYGNIAADYTIKISGTITGGVNIASTLTTEMASSLTLEGVTGKSGDTWVDVLNGGFSSSSKGTTLSINSAVPVTLKNLKITGGYQGGGSGAGIKLAGNSSLVMESGEISENTGNDSGQASAAGVYISHGGTANFGATQIAGAKFTMNGGSICNNTGTGVTLYDGSNPGEFNMYGGTITGNSGYGVNIVYSTGPFGKFTMKGSAVVTSDNKVFIGLPNGTKIYIADELTGTAPVATIKLNGYNENTEVIALANGVTDTSLLSAACAKIEVAPYNGTPWYLTSDGKLTSTNPNAGNSGGDPATWTGSADGHDYVNLGLPSGTLWATMNVGATSVTAPGSDYFWSVDPVKENILAKYTEAGETLLSADDHATVEWGSNWITPTTEQIQELCDKCYFEPVTSYNGVTINGYVVYLAKSQSHVNINELAPYINDAFTYPENYKKTGYSESDPHIFLPARNGGNDVWMWSSTYEGTGYSDNRPLANLFGLADGWGEIIETGIVSNDYTYEYPIRPVYVGSTGGNSGNTNSIPDDFVLVTGAQIDFNIGYGLFQSCETYPITIRSLYVCNHEVTQKEYEQYCIYGTEKDDEGNLGTQYAPTSAHGTGDNFPAYFVSWHDAIVYCNLRSLDEGLTPVYSLPKPKTDPDEALVYSTKPSEWVDIVTSGDKYCGPNLNYYYDIYSNSWSNWEWISASPGYESVRIDENANGYRLPTTEEWEYFARGGQGLKGAEAAYEHSGAIDDDAIDNVAHHTQYPYGSFNEDSTTFECGKDVNPNSLGLYDLCGNVKEWCFDLVDDDGQRWIIDGVEYDRNAMYTCDRKSTIGFRVVRNAE